ncbi:uncharacterized protein LOC122504088 [Leptopilina heterotoma]|uniref:uncharacterized protein LOC122504088 n=1 Tax=Leptopilina heterotoma TaxID=63436 RepID=UPI001CAA363C|nr:uncharacterized protein LOC122504088 [Leptopilina heterotoma]
MKKKTSHKMLASIFWNKIAMEMKKNGYKKSSTQCESKWKLLCRMYKEKQILKNQTGGKPVTWKYYDEMDEVMFNKPEITPLALASNLKGYRQKVQKQIKEKSTSNNDNDTEEEEDLSAHKIIKKRRTNLKKSSIDQFREEANLRHQENREDRKILFSILKELVEKK